MSDPLLTLNKKIFDNANMATTLTSETIDLAETLGYAVHAIWSGTPNGTISVQGSNSGVSTEFVEVSSDGTLSVAGQFLLNVEKHHYRYMRVQYLQTFASAGTLNCYVSGKRG
jgi:hypothetical protein